MWQQLDAIGEAQVLHDDGHLSALGVQLQHTATHLQVLVWNSSSSNNNRKWQMNRAAPSIRCGLHDELQVVSTLPPATGVGEVHFLPVLCHRQVVDEGQPPAANHLIASHKPP